MNLGNTETAMRLIQYAYMRVSMRGLKYEPKIYSLPYEDSEAST